MPPTLSPLALLKSHFNYEEFRPLQKDVIDNTLQQKDSLVLMPTGGGKSLCFQIPALCLQGTTLVISPLISLMKDQVDTLRAKGIQAAYLNSSQTMQESQQVQSDVQQGKIKLLYVAPERVSIASFQTLLQAITISLIAIDEAHCISQWGHDFRPDYRNLIALREHFAHVPCIALTATATERTRKDIASQLKLKGKMFVAGFNRPNLRYHVQPKTRDAFDILLPLLNTHKGKPTIIYCLSRKDTECLASDLCAEGFQARAYHAGLESNKRKAAQEQFLQGKTPIICATIAFGMGIDKADVRMVVHWTMPKDLEGYYQETGRAGRDGNLSDCVLFYAIGDVMKLRRFLWDIDDPKEQEHAHWRLKQMQRYAESRTCRRKMMLSYFGEQFPAEHCKGCDCCLPPSVQPTGTEASHRRRSRGRTQRIKQSNSTYQETKKLIDIKMPLEEVAQRRGFTVGTILQHLEALMTAGEMLNLDYLIMQLDHVRSKEIRSALE